MSGPLRAHPEGAVVAVRAQPGASRASIVGVVGDELKVRVCSPPVDGRANAELLAVLADALGVKPRELELVAGEAARSKQVLVRLPLAAAQARLHAVIGGVDTRGR